MRFRLSRYPWLNCGSSYSALDGPPEAAGFARSCLTTIDELRDDYGIASGDPRHPDIQSGKPWPPEAA
jgi:hypothetical protein